MKAELPTLLLILTSTFCAVQTNPANAQSIGEQFRDTQVHVLAEERDSHYVPWKSEIASFYADANQLFRSATAAASRCSPSKGPDPNACEFAAQNREAIILANLEQIDFLSDPQTPTPDADVDMVRPQIEDWYSSGFNKDRLGIEQYSGSTTAYQQEIARADLLRIRAKQLANAGDWTGGLILLRHSQLIMEALFFSVLPGN